MERKNSNRVKKLVKGRRRSQLLKRLVFSLACIVVFCTTYALILPAIAMTPKTYCGFEEHSHTEECFDKVLSCQRHEHTEACYDDVSVLICGHEETEGHTHSEGCYETTMEYICGQNESAGHVHDSSCYQNYTDLVCGQNEYDGHYHSDSCYDEEGNIVCGQSEYEGHYHSDSCYYTYQELVCGQEESTGHTHSDGCLVEAEHLVCGLEEVAGHHHDDSCFMTVHKEVCEAPYEDHVHTDDCYSKILNCELQEHIHDEMCYSDPEADVETAAQWERGLPQLTGNWGEDLVAVAKTQIDIKESAKNYQVVDGERQGITRYGSWYGTPYEEWSAMFASFCLYYAQVPNVTYHNDAAAWVMDFSNAGTFVWAADYTPVKGDLIFFDRNNDGVADHCGIVTGCDGSKIWTIEGDQTDKVKEETYGIYDNIYGYAILPVNPAFAVDEEQPAEQETEEETGAVDVNSDEGVEASDENIENADGPEVSASFAEEIEAAEEIGASEEGVDAVESTAEAPEEPADSDSAEGSSDENEAVESTVEEAEEPAADDEAEEESETAESTVEEAEETESTPAENNDAESNVEDAEEAAEAESMIEDVTEPAEADSAVEEVAEVESMVEDIEMTDSLSDHPEEVAEVESTVEEIIDPDAKTEKTVVGEDYIVTVTYTAAAEVPDNAELVVSEYEKDSEIYLQRYEEAAVLNDWKVFIDHTEEFRLFNIGLYVDGEEIEPKASVDVRITYPTLLTTAAEEAIKSVELFDTAEVSAPAELQVVHFDDEPKVMEIEQVNAGDHEVMEFTTDSFSDYGIMPTSVDPWRVPAGTYGQTKLSYNGTTNAFMSDSKYAQFYNAASPLGISGSFHIVAFDTANLNVHTNGNVLAKNVNASSNFGTNPKNGKDFAELSYIQNYLKVNGVSGASPNSYLVLGSSNTLGTADNNQALTVNGVKLDQPKNVVQDTNTASNPFIDLNYVKQDIMNINAYLASNQTTPGVDVNLQQGYIRIAQPDGASFVNITAGQLYQIGNGLSLEGFRSGHNGSLIINVDCSGWNGPLPLVTTGDGANVYVDGQKVNPEETVVFDNGKVIWNFVNTNGVTEINTGKIFGAIVAPNCTINLNSTVNGTVIGNKVNVYAESHRTDFTGTTIPTTVLIHAKKTVDGRVPTGTEVFSFKMEQYVNNNWVVVADDVHNNGSVINFPTMTYDKAGTYWYRISEKEDSAMADAGYSFDSKKYIIKVDVTEYTDSYGNKRYSAVATTYESEELGWDYWTGLYPIDRPASKCATTVEGVFENFGPVEEVIEVCKTVEGAELGDKKFTFVLSSLKLDNNGWPITPAADADVIETVTNDGSRVVFSPIKYTSKDAGYQYWYEVKETADPTMEEEGWTFDTHRYYVRISVFHQNGKLVTEKVWFDEKFNKLKDKPGFVNKFEEKIGIEVDKKWFNKDGEDVTDTTFDGKIEFELFRKTVLASDPTRVIKDRESLGKYEITSNIDPEKNWKWSKKDLPKSATEWVDNRQQKVTYLYYVEEMPLSTYKTEYENNDGIDTGVIIIKNTLIATYELPETGGPGTKFYMIFGIMLIAMSSIIYGFSLRRKCERRLK